MSYFTPRSLSKSLAELGVSDSHELFGLLNTLHTESTRHYHSDKHISACLKHFLDYRPFAQRPAEIEIAFWFHDAIYDTRSNDNEEQSAELAIRELKKLTARSEAIERIQQMILATKTHIPATLDAAIVVDIDLGILGSSPEEFENYDVAIRKEYDWVPEKQYKPARADVLETFLMRAHIYHTPAIREALEDQARENLTRKIAELRA